MGDKPPDLHVTYMLESGTRSMNKVIAVNRGYEQLL